MRFEEINISGNITKVMAVTTQMDYIEAAYSDRDLDDEDVIEELFDNPEVKAATEIIHLQVAYYLTRRLSYTCQSVSDDFSSMWHRKIREFEKFFGKEYIDYNKDTEW
jgi:hypothetical protein